MSPNRAAPSLALAAYAETWISGAKVVVFGDSSSPLPERLVERGARLVQVYDRDAARSAEAAALSHSHQIAYAPLENGGSVARDGVFDFGIVEDLGAGTRTDGLPLTALRRALGRRGMALIAARNSEVSRALIPSTNATEEPLGYYELYELVSQHFEEVRMLGQTAFVGYAVADFGAAEDSDVRLDTAFLPGGAEEPEWFLALVSKLPVTSEAFSVIQIPLAELPLPEVPGEQAEIERLEKALEQAETRIAELEKQRSAREAAKDAQAVQSRQEQSRQEQSRQEQSRQEQSRQEQLHRQQLDAQHRELESLKAELTKRDQWLAALESRAATADQRADDAQSELEQLAARVKEANQQKKPLELQLQEALRAKRALEDSQAVRQREFDELTRGSGTNAKNFAELERRAITLSTQLDELRAQLALSERQREASEEDAGDLRELEAQLVERGAEVARLTRELGQTERFGRQLIAQLEEAKAARTGETPKRELDRLARRNAELEADLEAARWTISSLGANVPGSAAAESPAPRREEGTNETARRSAD